MQVWVALSEKNAEGTMKGLSFILEPDASDTICPLEDGCEGTTAGQVTTPGPNQGIKLYS